MVQRLPAGRRAGVCRKPKPARQPARRQGPLHALKPPMIRMIREKRSNSLRAGRIMRPSMKLRLLILLLLLGRFSFAQTGMGKIQGTVRDVSGAVVPGAKVSVTHIQTARSYSTATNEVGFYMFPAVQSIGWLREAKPMKLAIEIDLPSNIDESMFEDAVAKPARQEIILRLFAERRLRASQATRLLGVSRLQFMELRKQRNIPYIDYTSRIGKRISRIWKPLSATPVPARAGTSLIYLTSGTSARAPALPISLATALVPL